MLRPDRGNRNARGRITAVVSPDFPRKPMCATESIAIVVATYNEIRTLPSLVSRIQELLPHARVLVVDDNSPDGTGRWAAEMAARQSWIEVLQRPAKEGLGRATLSGLKMALQYDVVWIATMDADHSHDPVDLKTMLQVASQPVNPPWDVVIGSRYIPGGRIESWPLHRRFVSRLVNTIARHGLGLPARDISGALRIYRRQTLQHLDLNRVQSRGHAYLEEILMLLNRAGAAITECPIHFRNRVAGRSTVNLQGWWFNARELAQLLLDRGRT